MELDQSGGILAIILGILIIIAPMFSSELISVIIGASLVIFGISLIVGGRSIGLYEGMVSSIFILLGIIAIIFGIIFIFFVSFVPFIVAFQFYIIAVIMILAGILGLVGPRKIFAILIILMGAIMFYLGTLSATNPIFAPILLGVCLIIEGIGLVVAN